MGGWEPIRQNQNRKFVPQCLSLFDWVSVLIANHQLAALIDLCGFDQGVWLTRGEWTERDPECERSGPFLRIGLRPLVLCAHSQPVLCFPLPYGSLPPLFCPMKMEFSTGLT